MQKLFKHFMILVFSLFLVHGLTGKCFASQDNNHSFYTVKASHILVDSKQSVDALKRQIDQGESFEKLASMYSKCPSGRNGGDLGYFTRGQMVKEFEDVAFSTPVGTVSKPVHTQFGWHLIKIYDKR